MEVFVFQRRCVCMRRRCARIFFDRDVFAASRVLVTKFGDVISGLARVCVSLYVGYVVVNRQRLMTKVRLYDSS